VLVLIELDVGSKWWDIAVLSLLPFFGTHKYEEPVSNTKLNCCSLELIFIVARNNLLGLIFVLPSSIKDILLKSLLSFKSSSSTPLIFISLYFITSFNH